MELETFKRKLWNQFKIKLHDVVVNTDVIPQKGKRTPVWTEIRWKDIPALVELSGHKYSTPIIKVLIGYSSKDTYSHQRYVYQIAFMKPLGEPSRIDQVIRQYQLGYINSIPRERSWLNRVTKIGSDLNSDPNTELEYESWAFHIQEILKGVLLWESIIKDPEIAATRKAYAEAKAKVRELQKVTTKLRTEFYSNGYSEQHLEHYPQLKTWKVKASKQLEIKCESRPRTYGGGKCYV